VLASLGLSICSLITGGSGMVVVEAEQAFFNFFFFFLSLGFLAFGTSMGASVVSSSLCSVGITGLVFFSFFFSVAFT
jgi:hypothetical protein